MSYLCYLATQGDLSPVKFHIYPDKLMRNDVSEM